MHIIYLGGGGLTDILISVPDLSMGFVLWFLNKSSVSDRGVDTSSEDQSEEK